MCEKRPRIGVDIFPNPLETDDPFCLRGEEIQGGYVFKALYGTDPLGYLLDIKKVDSPKRPLLQGVLYTYEGAKTKVYYDLRAQSVRWGDCIEQVVNKNNKLVILDPRFPEVERGNFVVACDDFKERNHYYFFAALAAYKLVDYASQQGVLSSYA